MPRYFLIAAFCLLAPTGCASVSGQTNASPASSLTPATVNVEQNDAPRNIVFILLDDLRYDGMGFLQPTLNTPAIDRLARGGAYFPNTVVTSSLCSPSRATILTGMTARNHGIIDNNDTSEAGLTFFPSYLQEAGYETAFIGKWHMGAASDAPRPGFDRWVSFRGQGSYYPEPDAPPERATTFNVDGEVVPQMGYLTDELTDYAINWLEQERDPSRPFFLYLSHKAVHSDPLPAQRHAGMYAETEFALPESAANTPENYAGKPMWVYNQRNTWHGIDFFYHSDMAMQEYLRFYYETLQSVDESVARIMASLEEQGLADDTLIVFTSDNGLMIGEHGLIDKRTAYEPSVRVPMIMYAPGYVPAGVTNTGRIRNLDFAPTLLGVAGVEIPAHFEGQNTWPLILGEIAPEYWETDDFIYEYYWEYNFPMTPTTFSITRGDLKYIQYYGVYDIEELYDLRNDPHEMNNLAYHPDYFNDLITLRAALYEQLADTEGRHVIPYGQRQSRGSVRRMRGGTQAAPFPEEWYVEPNRLDRLDDIVPDNPDKRAAHEAGRPFIPFPVLGQPGNDVPPVDAAEEHQ